jgi:hypothetical protein
VSACVRGLTRAFSVFVPRREVPFGFYPFSMKSTRDSILYGLLFFKLEKSSFVASVIILLSECFPKLITLG